MKYKLYLDDVRLPTQTFNTTNGEWVIVRSYDEFVDYILKNGLPWFISFDHDLAHEHYRESMYDADGHYSKYYKDGTFKEKTGFSCAEWLVEYCMNNKVDLPEWNVHSANPIGRDNIAGILRSYAKFSNENP